MSALAYCLLYEKTPKKHPTNNCHWDLWFWRYGNSELKLTLPCLFFLTFGVDLYHYTRKTWYDMVRYPSSIVPFVAVGTQGIFSDLAETQPHGRILHGSCWWTADANCRARSPCGDATVLFGGWGWSTAEMGHDCHKSFILGSLVRFRSDLMRWVFGREAISWATLEKNWTPNRDKFYSSKWPLLGFYLQIYPALFGRTASGEVIVATTRWARWIRRPSTSCPGPGCVGHASCSGGNVELPGA
jgi:hypothetical protein